MSPNRNHEGYKDPTEMSWNLLGNTEETKTREYFIANCSHGKDSQAMVRGLIQKGYPLDEVVFYDTGAEFKAIYDARDHLLPLLKEKGIKYTELHPTRSFFYDMLDKPVYSKKNGHHCGYGWCGGRTRWGTAAKRDALEKYINRIRARGFNVTQYIGIAADEAPRIARNSGKGKRLPLVEWGWTEHYCLELCYAEGVTWEENGIRLYDILDRVSCWCCANKNLKELRNIRRELPEYWERMKDLQDKIDKPFRAGRTSKNGRITPARSIYDLDEQFAKEEKMV